MKKAFTIFVGFIHDFAAGCWAATVLAVYWLERISHERPEISPVLNELQKEFFYLGLFCAAIVLLAGSGRTFTYAYVANAYGEDAEKLRRRMLLAKHIVLFVVFGAGIYWQYTLAFQ